MNKRLLEKDLYPSVVEYFVKKGAREVKTEPTIVLKTAEGRPLKPDVIAYFLKDGDNFEIHLAEGKRSWEPRSWGDCIRDAHELQSTGYSDYIYLFFPSKDWDNIPPTHLSRRLGQCKIQGFGILLINDDGDCYEELAPKLQPMASNKRKMEVKKQMNVDYFPSIEAFNSDEFSKLLNVISYYKDLMNNQVIKAFKKIKLRPRDHCSFSFLDYPHESKYLSINVSSMETDEKLIAEVDLLGWYNKDNKPSLYIRLERISFNKFKKLLNNKILFGTMYYIEKLSEDAKPEDWERGKLADLDLQNIERLEKIFCNPNSEDSSEIQLLSYIETNNKLKSQIQEDVKNTLVKAVDYLKQAE